MHRALKQPGDDVGTDRERRLATEEIDVDRSATVHGNAIPGDDDPLAAIHPLAQGEAPWSGSSEVTCTSSTSVAPASCMMRLK